MRSFNLRSLREKLERLCKENEALVSFYDKLIHGECETSLKKLDIFIKLRDATLKSIFAGEYLHHECDESDIKRNLEEIRIMQERIVVNIGAIISYCPRQ